MLHTDGLIVPKIFALMLLINLCDEKEWISKHVALDEKVLRCALAGLKSASVANAASTAAHLLRGIATATRGICRAERSALWQRHSVGVAVARAAAAHLDGRGRVAFVDTGVVGSDDVLFESALRVIAEDPGQTGDGAYRAELLEAGAGRLLVLLDSEGAVAKNVAHHAPLLRLQLALAPPDSTEWKAAIALSMMGDIMGGGRSDGGHFYEKASPGYDKVLDGIRAERGNANKRVWMCDSPACDAGPATGKLFKCTACKRAHYCSRACQKADWPVHKLTCRKAAA